MTDRDEASLLVASLAFEGLGFGVTAESVARSILSTAWTMGLEPTSLSERGGPWTSVTIRYHYEEALVILYWAMQAEVSFGYISKVMQLAETTDGLPIRALSIEPREIMRAMTQWSLSRAGQRARMVGSPGVLLPSEATQILKSRATQYVSLVTASVQETRPIPSPNFQLGLSREHPWTGFLCCCADNLTESLNLEPEMRGLASIHLQLAASKIQAGLYAALQNPAHVINN